MAKDRVEAGRGRRADVVKKSKASKSNRPFYAALALIALVGVGALGYVATRPKNAATTVDGTIAAGEAQGYLLGNPNAPVQVVEFADFECPACSRFATLTEPDVKKRLVDAGIISYRFYDFPLPGHKHTWEASNAAACANEQGKFWEMHDQLFDHQDQWNGQATNRPKTAFQGYARAIGLNMEQWDQCYDSRKYQPQIKASEQLAMQRGVSQTPTFIIGNKMIGGAIGYDAFKAYVDSALASAPKDTTGKAGAARDTAAKSAAAPAKGATTP